MADSDQAIRDIVAQLVSNGQPAPGAAPAQAPYDAPEVTPTMLQGTAAAPASQPIAIPGPGAPLVITPPTAAAPASVSAGEDWTAPAPTMVAPAVTPLGAMAAVQRPAAPAMGMVLGVPVRR